MNIKDLIDKRAKVWETAKNFVDTHEDKNGVLSEEDTTTYNKMEKEIEDLFFDNEKLNYLSQNCMNKREKMISLEEYCQKIYDIYESVIAEK